MHATPDLLQLRVDELLETLAGEAPAPAGGAAAALAASVAAALLAKVARTRLAWDEAGGMVAQAQALRARAAALAQTDANEYEAALEALRAVAEGAAPAADLGEAVARAGDVPLAIGEAATDILGLAVELAERGDPAKRADAVVAAFLAEAAVRAARELVAVNLTVTRDDERLRRASLLAERARSAAAAVVAGAAHGS